MDLIDRPKPALKLFQGMVAYNQRKAWKSLMQSPFYGEKGIINLFDFTVSLAVGNEWP
jgi:hypothetical protein